MTKAQKLGLILLGVVTTMSLILQLGLGLTILNAKANPDWQEKIQTIIRAHQHSGYLAVCLALIYVTVSLVLIIRQPVHRSS